MDLNRHQKVIARFLSQAPGALPGQPNDETSSNASFEEIAANKALDLAAGLTTVIKVGSQEFQDGVIPDVLYVVHFRDAQGNTVETRQSDKPIDFARDGINEESSDMKKPVIEIVTKVTVNANGTNAKRSRKARRHSFSDSGSDSEDEGRDLDASKRNPTSMILHSKHLKNALSAVVGYYPGTEFLEDFVELSAPYQVLMHHREALAAYKYNQPACHSTEYRETTIKHIDVLLGYLDATFGEQIRDEERRQQNNPPAATFAWLWLLLKPGEVIYAKENDIWTPFILSRVKTYYGLDKRPTQHDLACWQLSYQFGKIIRKMESFTIPVFSGEQALHSLPVIPARYFPEDLDSQDGKTMAEWQVELGKAYWDLCKGPAYKEYDGPLISKDVNTDQNGGHMSGRVIVDSEGYERYRFPAPGMPGMPRPPPHVHGMRPPPAKDQLPAFSPRCNCTVCSLETRQDSGTFAKFEDLKPSTSDPPKSDLYYLALSSTIPAFILADRRWGHVHIASLKEVKPDREAFKYLVLDDEIKLTVRSLIGKFASEDGKVSPWPRDIVKNKGEGRIFLLHGSPGVGKTCTAECIAELTHRPLLSLTSGDISTDMTAVSVERNLQFFLNLGERYGALVLLDEADVYLEARRTKDLARNGLVSIFLRALEYYRGVLFLTTNRVEAFDSAFTSRIHVALHYKRLTDQDRFRIWNNNFERLERDSNSKVYVSKSTREFVYDSDDVRALRWNGREIRNALQTAVALAETEALDDGSDKVNVTEQHLQAVVKMSKGFKDFLHRRRGWANGDSDSEDEDDDDDDNDSTLTDD